MLARARAVAIAHWREMAPPARYHCFIFFRSAVHPSAPLIQYKHLTPTKALAAPDGPPFMSLLCPSLANSH